MLCIIEIMGGVENGGISWKVTWKEVDSQDLPLLYSQAASPLTLNKRVGGAG